MDHIGIDVHKKDSQICILTEHGELLERRVRTEPRRFAEELGTRPPARILIESATESEWVARCLEALGDFAWSERAALKELDVNPIVVRESGAGCVVVDALIVPL